ncbi:YqhA family protein [Paraburkholderia sp. BL10I2N1]|uniref:YqhA family protein n=1 Tax=Paraburkholderia sp. BL10I2N1 TaxID=1938796 RepID=UPI00105EAB78|nr:YqhA family protein [Paraburkholderia sp. BL10I2N1]TDN70162.1 putative membrane protein YqhA [Paraburkholderia sp. BL10I2N1]
MLRRILASSRYIMLVPVIGTFLGSIALILYEATVLSSNAIDTVRNGAVSTKSAKIFAVGIVEAVDVFLIAIAVYIISIGLYSLFIDDKLPLPKWLEVNNLEDLKGNLVSVVIAVLSVLFLREAVAWDGTRDIAAFGGTLALVVAALTFFLMKNNMRRE